MENKRLEAELLRKQIPVPSKGIPQFTQPKARDEQRKTCNCLKCRKARGEE